MDWLEVLGFVCRLLHLRGSYWFSVTSWGHTVYHNTHLKPPGDSRSRHLEWLAVDVVLDPNWMLEDFLGAVHAVGLYYQVEADHIHIQAGPRG